MDSRRRFLAHAPLGLLGALAACGDGTPRGGGGAAPRQRIKPGTRIITWTEDCFDGLVTTAADLPSTLIPPGNDNPQTGPFYIEGAERGDTFAVHILRLEPARTYAISAFSPGFGALVGTDCTAILGPDSPETTWRYEVDAARNVARTTARDRARGDVRGRRTPA